MSIRSKLLLAFVSAIILPLGIIAVIVINQARDQALSNFQDLTNREVIQIDRGLSSFFAEIVKDVDFLASHPKVLAATTDVTLYKNSDTSSELDALAGSQIERQAFTLFSHFGETHPGLAYVYMGNQEGGYIQWPQSAVGPRYDPTQRPWYQHGANANGETVRTNAYYWAADDTVIVSTVKAVKEGGQVVGVQGMDVSLKALTDMVKKITLGESGYLMLVEDSGTVLVNPKDPEHNFKQFSQVSNGAFSELAQSRNGDFEVTLAGEDYYAHLYTSPQLGWKFIGLVPQSEVMAAANAMTWTIIIVCLVLAGIFALLGNTIAGLISGPIITVSKGLEDISEGDGDLTQRLQVSSKDETGALAANFNVFLTSIAKLVAQINDTAKEVNEAATHSLSLSSSLNGYTDQQQQALAMAATAINEMAATANEVAQSCANAADLAQQTRDASEQGQEVITEAVASVTELSQAITSAASDITQLAQESESITSILDVIRAIAEQTNLLALNAAIEAARAGEHGRGFSVVADEVRALSQRTSQSTEEIATQLDKLRAMSERVAGEMNQSLARSTQTVEQTNAAQQQFVEINRSVMDISDLNTQIATAAEEQQHVAEDINRNVVEIKTAADEVSEVATKTDSSGQRLDALAKQLAALVGRFKT
ncbi:Methyl-accepting chemotaxis protein PctB [Pseudoalteromonas sp. THAF3]|uniref:methyl-accepting chemotaxis protein n=1 Tax=Pseudoalteromonas sp. THAF3 TaxID=2587843 RepID=UPI00126875FB|nr:methyl-accepting chemotaxis protein [Pseudoalteromonas sp. THAF3]QFU06292.1 Methyl-accepting chemotaxis protein PctB [Pseudoalteromonas sp. THAF3]